MKVHIIKLATIKNYVEANNDCHSAFFNWVNFIKSADWKKPSDILSTFRNADILGKGTNRVIFNIGGNNYRMICSYYFGTKTVHLYINWIGTHSEYDKLCKQNLQYTIDNY